MYNVLIRPLVEADAEISYKWRNDKDIWKYTGARPNIEVTEHVEREWIKKVLKDLSSRRFAILVDEEYVGNIQLTDISATEAEYHIFIGNRAFWGKGIAQAATYQLLFFAKEILHLKVVNLRVNKYNIAAVSVYEKAGFSVTQHEGESIWMSCELKYLAQPHVSIFMMVYNHAPFLKQALESILIQKTLLNTVLVVGEDYSNDGSRQIIEAYAQKYPGKFKLLLHDKNVGATANQTAVLQSCTGKYISICEGDDYWIDSHKLQSQFNFLEKNEDYGLICSRYDLCSMKDGGEIVSAGHLPLNDRDISTVELLRGNLVGSVTVMFKNGILDLEELDKGEYIDIYFWLYISQNWKIRYQNKVTAIYRVLPNSASGRINIDRQISFYEKIYSITQYFLDKLLLPSKERKKILFKKFEPLAGAYRKKKNNVKFFTVWKNFVLEYGINKDILASFLRQLIN